MLPSQTQQVRGSSGYGAARRQALEQQLARWRQQPDGVDQIQRLLEPYRRRMYDISIFIKELKGRFAQWYNRRHGRYGVLWADRFKSVLLEGGEGLAAVGAYIDLNPVRLVAFPEAHGAFADHRDDFSLLDKIKQVFPEIVCPNRAHPQFIAGRQSAEPASVARCCIDVTIGFCCRLKAICTERKR